MVSETSDDILAKYRKQPAASDSSNQAKDKAEVREESDGESTPAYDPNNLEHCKAFLDAKKKLRMVLSTADFQVSLTLTQQQKTAKDGVLSSIRVPRVEKKNV